MTASAGRGDGDRSVTPGVATPGEAHRRRLPVVLAGASVGAVAIALVLLIGLAVGHWPFDFDRAIILNLRAWGGPSWLPKVAADVTALGGGVVLTIIVVLAAGLLAVQRLWLSAAATLAASISGGMVVALVKTEVARPRPDIVDHLVQVSNMSFPSGHSANSAIVYLTLAGLASPASATVTKPGRALRLDREALFNVLGDDADLMQSLFSRVLRLGTLNTVEVP